MKKEALAAGVLMLLTGAMLYAPTTAKAYEENGFSYEVEDNEAMIQGLSADATEDQKKGVLSIPSSIGGFKVTGILTDSFSYNNYEEIRIPDTVTYIGSSAFSRNSKLKKVRLSQNLTEINYGLFESCDKLESVTIPGHVKNISSYAFARCASLKSVKVPDSVKEIGERAFAECYKLKDVKLGEKLQTIGSSAFYKNYALGSIVIPAKVKKVENGAFESCTDIKTVQFKNPATKLGTAVFSKCKSLTRTVVPSKITMIPERTFYKCRSIRQLQIPSTVKIIKREAFRGCENLKKVKLKKNIYALGDSAFAESGIQKIVLNKKLQFIGNGAFKKTDIKNIAFSDKLTYVGNRLFSDCDKLKTVSIPASVKGINPGAFSRCTSLRSIHVSSANKKYSSVDGVLYNKNRTKLIQYPMHKTNKKFTVPLTVKNIRGYAFANNDYLREVNVTAKTIGRCAFYNMKNLSKIVLNEGTKKIGDEAFRDNQKLTRVDVPDSITEIGFSAFEGCAVRAINIPSSLKKLGAYAFVRCYSLKKFEGGTGKSYKVKDGVLYNGKGTTLIQYPAKKQNKKFVVGNKVRKVKTLAFDHARKIRTLEFGSALRFLAYESIKDCSNLKSIAFTNRRADKNMQVRYNAVANCDQLAVIVGPNSYVLRSLAYSANATYITM